MLIFLATAVSLLCYANSYNHRKIVMMASTQKLPQPINTDLRAKLLQTSAIVGFLSLTPCISNAKVFFDTDVCFSFLNITVVLVLLDIMSS